MFVGDVYDPTVGDDPANFLGVEPARARASLRRVIEAIARAAARHGTLVDLHAHFLGGDPSRFVKIIEPSLAGHPRSAAASSTASSVSNEQRIRRLPP